MEDCTYPATNANNADGEVKIKQIIYPLLSNGQPLKKCDAHVAKSIAEKLKEVGIISTRSPNKWHFKYKYPESTRPRPVALSESWESLLGFTWDEVVNPVVGANDVEMYEGL